MAGEGEGSSFGAHERSELVVHNLHHKLLGLDGVDYILTHGFLLHSVDEALGHGVAYVGLDEGLAHVLKSFGNVYFGDASLALENLEAAFKAVAEIFKHTYLIR